MNFDVLTFNQMWEEKVFHKARQTDFEGKRFLSLTVVHYKMENVEKISNQSFTFSINPDPVKTNLIVDENSTTDELEKFYDAYCNENYQDFLPNYSDPGRILVDVRDVSDDPNKKVWEYEILDYDSDSCVFFITESTGIGFWLDYHYGDFTEDGTYLFENITGIYVKGDWGHTDDYEEWSFDEPVKTNLKTLPDRE